MPIIILFPHSSMLDEHDWAWESYDGERDIRVQHAVLRANRNALRRLSDYIQPQGEALHASISLTLTRCDLTMCLCLPWHLTTIEVCDIRGERLKVPRVQKSPDVHWRDIDNMACPFNVPPHFKRLWSHRQGNFAEILHTRQSNLKREKNCFESVLLMSPEWRKVYHFY